MSEKLKTNTTGNVFINTSGRFASSSNTSTLLSDMVPEHVVTDLLQEIERLKNDNKNWQARYDALLQTNEHLRHKGNAVTDSGFSKEEVRLMINHMHPDKHGGKEIYNSITKKLNSIKEGR
tara:strand:+ start:1063 stop:1425 length:363 start_codon:yes stop_codon:yes gene_type:complete